MLGSPESFIIGQCLLSDLNVVNPSTLCHIDHACTLDHISSNSIARWRQLLRSSVTRRRFLANMLMLGQRWPNVCSYVGSTSHANVGSTLFCSLGLRWPYRWRQPFANLQPMLIQRWPNVIQYGITLGQR